MIYSYMVDRIVVGTKIRKIGLIILPILIGALCINDYYLFYSEWIQSSKIRNNFDTHYKNM